MLISPAEPHRFYKLGKVSSLPEKHGTDFFFVANKLRYGVQRKELRDLVASVQDGRLAKEVAQMQGLDAQLLVVEGRAVWDEEGNLRDQYVKWTRGQHFGTLWSVQRAGVWVVGTDSAEETVAVLAAFEAWCRKEKHTSLSRRPGPVVMWGKPDNLDYQKHLVMGLPGVGPELAARIVEEVGMPFGWREGVGVEALMGVQGIGRRKAEQLIGCLGVA